MTCHHDALTREVAETRAGTSRDRFHLFVRVFCAACGCEGIATVRANEVLWREPGSRRVAGAEPLTRDQAGTSDDEDEIP
jgi:hypothetical protein